MENTARKIEPTEVATLSLVTNVVETPALLIRFAAYFIDLILIGTLSALVTVSFSVIYAKFSASLGLVAFQDRNPIHIKLFNDVVMMIVFSAYMCLSLWYSNGSTVGKKLLKLKVVLSSGQQNWSFSQALARSCAYSLSYLLLGAGFALALVRKDKKSLHDLVSKSFVTNVN
jgi:uncharacterized RDD family membrane protein YckC